MTREEVALACGLQDPHEYIKQTGKGHTTKMLCNAVASVSLGRRVVLVAHSAYYAKELKRKAHEMAARCGIRDARFECYSFGWWTDYGDRLMRGTNDLDVLRDHYHPR
jgi:hypothetical protein